MKKKYEELAAALGVNVEAVKGNVPKGYSAFVLDPYWTNELVRFIKGEGGYRVGSDFTILNYKHRGHTPETTIRRLPSGGLLFEINPEGRG